MNPPTKTAKAEAIARCANIIADHFGFPPDKIFTDIQSKSLAVREGRALLIYHLHRCGMSYLAISRLVKRSEDHVRRSDVAGKTASSVDKETADLLARLPQIPTTLEITAAVA